MGGRIANQNNIPRLYQVRCGFDYCNGTQWRSQWNRTQSEKHDIENSAWFNAQKHKIASAVIEVKQVSNPVTKKVVECTGYEFRSFEWVCITLSPIRMKVGKEALTNKNQLNNFVSEGENVGLVLVTDKQRVTFYVDGKINIEQRENDNQDFKAIGGING